MGATLVGCENSHEVQAKETMMMTKQMTLRDVMDYIGDHLTLRREKIESLFGATPDCVRVRRAKSGLSFWRWPWI
jgi:hypothetical protein